MIVRVLGLSCRAVGLDDAAQDAGRRRHARLTALPGDVGVAGKVPPRLTGSTSGGGYLPYGERKPYVVAETLPALSGPTRGVVTLPRHLDGSGQRRERPEPARRLASIYKVMLTEAGTVEDFLHLAQAKLLLRLWPARWLPPQLRWRWEEPRDTSADKGRMVDSLTAGFKEYLDALTAS